MAPSAPSSSVRSWSFPIRSVPDNRPLHRPDDETDIVDHLDAVKAFDQMPRFEQGSGHGTPESVKDRAAGRVGDRVEAHQRGLEWRPVALGALGFDAGQLALRQPQRSRMRALHSRRAATGAGGVAARRTTARKSSFALPESGGSRDRSADRCPGPPDRVDVRVAAGSGAAAQRVGRAAGAEEQRAAVTRNRSGRHVERPLVAELVPRDGPLLVEGTLRPGLRRPGSCRCSRPAARRARRPASESAGRAESAQRTCELDSVERVCAAIRRSMVAVRHRSRLMHVRQGRAAACRLTQSFREPRRTTPAHGPRPAASVAPNRQERIEPAGAAAGHGRGDDYDGQQDRGHQGQRPGRWHGSSASPDGKAAGPQRRAGDTRRRIQCRPAPAAGAARVRRSGQAGRRAPCGCRSRGAPG